MDSVFGVLEMGTTVFKEQKVDFLTLDYKSCNFNPRPLDRKFMSPTTSIYRGTIFQKFHSVDYYYRNELYRILSVYFFCLQVKNLVE